MKSSDFMEQIKKVIAEEVRIAVRAEMRGIKEEVKSALSEMINEQTLHWHYLFCLFNNILTFNQYVPFKYYYSLFINLPCRINSKVKI